MFFCEKEGREGSKLEGSLLCAPDCEWFRRNAFCERMMKWLREHPEKIFQPRLFVLSSRYALFLFLFFINRRRKNPTCPFCSRHFKFSQPGQGSWYRLTLPSFATESWSPLCHPPPRHTHTLSLTTTTTTTTEARALCRRSTCSDNGNGGGAASHCLGLSAAYVQAYRERPCDLTWVL